MEDDYPSYWANFIDDKNVDKFGLPKTSAQYVIESSKLETLFLNLIIGNSHVYTTPEYKIVLHVVCMVYRISTKNKPINFSLP